MPPLFPELFESQVTHAPERVALFCRGTELTYRALDQRANQFANHVRNSGAAPEALVAVVLPQGLDQIAAIIGVPKAGAAYVPIDPSYPASRIRHILDDARPHVIIDEEVVAVVDRWCAERADGVAGLAELDAGNAAYYVIYTSGSTGAPKGVVIEHGSLARYLAWTTVAYRGTRGVSVVPTSIAFDLTVTGLFTTLAVGGWSTCSRCLTTISVTLRDCSVHLLSLSDYDQLTLRDCVTRPARSSR